MRRITRIVLCVMILAAVAGCGTMAGLGRDLQAVGELMEHSEP